MERTANSFAVPVAGAHDDCLSFYCEKMKFMKDDVLIVMAPNAVDVAAFERFLTHARETLGVPVFAVYEGMDCFVYRKK